MAFEIAIHRTPAHCFVKINFIAVEVGAVNTCELCDALAVPVQGEAAAAAHACAVDHYRVH